MKLYPQVVKAMEKNRVPYIPKECNPNHGQKLVSIKINTDYNMISGAAIISVSRNNKHDLIKSIVFVPF